MRKPIVMLIAAALVLSASALADNRGPSFTPIGFIENPGNYPASGVLAMNPEGTEFVVTPSFLGNYAALWTREGGWGAEIGASRSVPRISSAGTVMTAGLFPGSNPAYAWPGTWLGGVDEFDPIPPQAGYAPCGNLRMGFSDMGGDGDFATGLTWSGCGTQRAFVWSRATGTTVELGTPNGRSTSGSAITDDGTKVAGRVTMANGLRRGATWQDGAWTWLDGQGDIEPLACIRTGSECTGNDDCAEFVDDGSCPPSLKGTCTAGVCVGGYDAGANCTNSGQCRGICSGGPNAGEVCTSNGNCPDTPVCVANAAWSDAAFKGLTHDMTVDGRYVVGRNFGYDVPEWYSGYRLNPDGSITEIPTLAGFPDLLVDPYAISTDGQMVAGLVGTAITGYRPIFWTEATGTVDLQFFLVAQGLDELFFWNLRSINDLSDDGTVLGGQGINPNGRLEGFVVDMKKVWVCHAPGGDPDKARTLGIGFDAIADHVGHGDFLSTCDFLNTGGGFARAAELQRHWLDAQDAAAEAYRFGNESDFDGWNHDSANLGRRNSIETLERRHEHRRR